MFSKAFCRALRGGVNFFHIKEVMKYHMRNSPYILRHHHCMMLPESILQSPDFFFRQVGNAINLLHIMCFETWGPNRLTLFCFNFKTVGPSSEFRSVWATLHLFIIFLKF
jgi:hypothetical protein